MILKDQLNRKLQIHKTPQRIVSLVPSQTELICYLGLEDRIVGITKFCVHPSYLRQAKTIVGGTKTVHFDKIKALNPDIILCNKEENTKEMIASLEQIAPVHISDVFDIADNLELVFMYGELFDKVSESNELISAIKETHSDFKTFMQEQPTYKTAYFIWKSPYMVAASHNFIDAMLSLNNFENVFKEQSRYPETSLQELKTKQPELLLLSSEPFPFKNKDVEEFQKEFPEATIKIVDGEMFSWYGSRLLKAFQYFKTLQETLNR